VNPYDEKSHALCRGPELGGIPYVRPQDRVVILDETQCLLEHASGIRVC
jgi:hypothetical protein